MNDCLPLILVLLVVALPFNSRPSFSADTVTFDVSGIKGTDGSKEHNYSTYSGAASWDGRNGADASPSTPGKNGGNIELLCTDQTLDANTVLLSLQGTVQKFQQAPQPINQQQSFARIPSLQLLATGGKGGDGGQGGDGEGGGKGSTGSAATRSSRGGTGGRGHDGGRGGDGTPGSDGGTGGNILVSFPLSDVYLALLIDSQVRGGGPGAAGKNGQGGSGGDGGSGGSSYYDSQRVEDGRDCDLVSNGNGGYTNKCHTKYKTVTYSQPGGSSGVSGSRGRDGQGKISPGRPGKDGSITYQVIYPDGSKKNFQRPYQLVVKSYSLVDENQDGIVEPDETMFARNIIIQNQGEMPSAAGKVNIKTYLESSGITVIQDQLTIPRLEKGEIFQYPGELIFKIQSSVEIGRNRSFGQSVPVTLRAQHDKLRIPVPSFRGEKQLKVSYPVEISFFEVPSSMAPGETRKIRIGIKNVSLQDLGLQSTSGRRADSILSLEGPNDQLAYYRLTGPAGTGVQLETTIPKIKAGEEIIIDATLSADAKTPVYTNVEVANNLRFQKLQDAKSNHSTIQHNFSSVRMSATYKTDTNTQVLLVTNANTERAEFLAWTKMLNMWEIPYAVWDISYYQSFDMEKTINGDPSLLEQFARKTIVFLDNALAEKRGRGSDYLSSPQFLNGVQKYQINFLFIGNPTAQVPALLERLITDESNLRKGLSAVVSKPFYRSLDKELVAAATSLNKSLLKKRPAERFVIQVSKKSDEEGAVLFFPTMVQGKGQAYVLPYEDQDVHQAERVTSEDSMKALLLALPFYRKVSLLEKQVNSSLVVNSIIHDLVQEFDYLDQLDQRGQSLDLFIRFDKLNYFVSQWKNEGSLSGRAPVAGSSITRILAALQVYVNAQSKFWFNRATVNYVKDQMAQLPLSRDEQALVKSEIQRLTVAAKERAKQLPGIEKRTNLKNMLVYPAIHRVQSTETLLQENLIINRRRK